MSNELRVVNDTSGPVVVRANLENSVWYGSSLITFLASAEMTGGRYALQRMHLTKGFAPPAAHRHGPEDFYILSGEIRFWAGKDEFVARAGDFVRTIPGGWHTLQAETDDAEALIIFSPAGMERFFQSLARPAESLELPGGRVGPPDAELMRQIAPRFNLEFGPPGKTAAEMTDAE